ncbi:MAG: transcription elongation factor GreA [Acidimicrobiia bacterium]|nr:MAG: transcription elongation factor GreA [Acidimicrobiia bacterium]
MTETTWLTPAAHEKLVTEFEHLTTVGRREAEKRIAEARAHGDLRENAEYDTAKNDQGLMELRIRQLRQILDSAEVRDVEDSGAVEVGTVATVIDEDGDEIEFFVAPSENKAPGILLASPQSPLGTALLGARPGDDVSYEAPGGTFTYRIVSIRVYEG